MKKIISFLFVIVILATMFLVTVNADFSANNVPNGQVVISETNEYIDGYCIKTIITEEPTVNTRASTFTKTGSKSYVLTNSSGDELWRFKVNGTFSVETGVSAICTNSTYTITISNDAWENKSASASRSGNKALGEAVFVKKLLFITTETKECSVTLTCDKNGNLS